MNIDFGSFRRFTAKENLTYLFRVDNICLMKTKEKVSMRGEALKDIVSGSDIH